MRKDSLHEEGGHADISEADRDVVEAREDIWSMSGEFVDRHYVGARKKSVCTDRVLISNSSNKDIHVVRETETKLDTEEDNVMDDLWNKCDQRALAESCSGSTTFRILNQRPHPRFSRVDGT